jgi:hypothetical protein
MKTVRSPWLKSVILLVISLGLFWFSEDFSLVRFFEPQSIGWKLWISYAKDLMQPFALYLFLCLGEKWLKTWQVRAALAFSIPLLLEIFQFLYYRLAPTHYVGSFDPLDIVMYVIGIALAVVVEQLILAKALQPQLV